MCTLDLCTVFGLTPFLTPQCMALLQSYTQRVPAEGTNFQNYKLVEA